MLIGRHLIQNDALASLSDASVLKTIMKLTLGLTAHSPEPANDRRDDIYVGQDPEHGAGYRVEVSLSCTNVDAITNIKRVDDKKEDHTFIGVLDAVAKDEGHGE